MKSTRFDHISQCPGCGYKMDAATHIEDDSITPEAGDISLCMKCGKILQFDEDMRLIPATSEHLAEVEPLELQQLLKYQAKIRDKGRTL